MKKIIFGLLFLSGIWSCTDPEPEVYSGQKLDFELFKSSDFDYSGQLSVQELKDGSLEFTLLLTGPSSASSTVYPAHLHFGTYDQADTPIAAILNSIPSKELKSVTILNQLSDGNKLDFDAIRNFNGHVKVHLAADGPDYGVILVAGNVGNTKLDQSEFDRNKIAVCGKSF
jgi:hypothetical protein